ncbi:MAG: hypothetical protein HOW73_20975 [Polyangiaceae bacterium]|nr:hypothetical protein [Polyangiaceae bacterium]
MFEGRFSLGLLASLVLVACSDSDATGGGGSNNDASDGGGGSNAQGGGGTNAGGAATGGSTNDGGSGGAPECVGNGDCELGSICSGGSCVPGCADDHPCAGTLGCCDGECFDLMTDLEHCGSCDESCEDAPHAEAICNGACGYEPCEAGFNDCNGSMVDGCETAGDCACTPGDTQTCYEGPPGTDAFPPCQAGTRTCLASGTLWGPCFDQIFPIAEICGDNVDNNCDGTVDNVLDLDGDGWTPCDGDCCDDAASGNCGTPGLVNPGAFEVAGNMVDDDCDGVVDNVLGACDGALASNSSDALDYARAMELCAMTTESPALPQRRWGVISANFYRANGAGTPAANSKSIRQGFGSGVNPLAGNRLAVLSTGVAAASTAPNNTSPNYAAFQGGQNMGTTSPVPSDWLTANGNNFPNAPGCPEPQGGTTANDPIMLKVRVRVPTNAKSFSLSTNFYSSEYPEWVCSAFNDFFLTLLDSSFVPGPGQTANPADKNLAFYDAPPAGGSIYPVGVNLAFGNTGLFTQCKNGSTGCGSGSVSGTTNTCAATTQLTGTGFDVVNPPPQFAGDPGYCGTNNFSGGATSWLTTSGNVTPGETIELRFVTWDTGDAWYDSLVLLDNFQWSVDASTPGTKID